MDISEYEGTILTFDNQGFSALVKVLLADNDVGYTLTDPYDPEDFYTCQIGPSSHKYRKSGNPERDAKLWERKKEYLIEACEKGVFSVDDFKSYVYSLFTHPVSGHGNPSSSTCAFS